MKSMLTINELAAEVQRQKAAKVDYVADTRRVSVHAAETDDARVPISIVVDGEGGTGELGEYGIRPHAHTQLGTWAKLPKAYYDRMLSDAPDLLATNLNHWFARTPAKRMLRTLDGDLRAFVSDRYRRLDNYDLAEHVLPLIGAMPDARFEGCGITETRMYLKVVLPRITADVRVGDTVCSGVVITNSEVGASSLSVEPLIYRLWCNNGAIAAHTLRKYHTGRRIEESDEALGVYRDETLAADDAAFFLKVRDLVTAACDEALFAQLVAQCKELADLRIEGDPIPNVERLAERTGLTETERGSVLAHLVEGGDLSAWGYVNAITRASQDVADFDRATELERVGGQLINMPRGEWSNLVAVA